MSHPHIFYGVLNWGLGHAARSIPVIRALDREGCHLTIGSDGDALAMLQLEFPAMTFVRLPSYRVRYQHRGSLLLKMARQLPRLRQVIQAEQAATRTLVESGAYDAIISDNRYGVYARAVPSVLITHQLRLLLGSRVLNAVVNAQLQRIFTRFDEIWVPDFAQEGHALAGALSRAHLETPVLYIGPLSRFELAQESKSRDVVVLLSGPEPQRSILEKKLRPQLEAMELNSLVLRGKPGEADFSGGRVAIRSHLPTHDLQGVLIGAKAIIARAGYSTIMDLHRLGKSAILIPTPGQPEQRYLAKHLASRGWHYFASQHALNIDHALGQLRACRAPAHPGVSLAETVSRWISKSFQPARSQILAVSNSIRSE